MFLLDENLKPSFSHALVRLGFEASHVYELGLKGSPDEKLLAFARSHGWIIITYDLDFTTLVATQNAKGPSVISIRLSLLTEALFIEIMSQCVTLFANEIEIGCLITCDNSGFRIRLLPVYPVK